MAEFIESDMKFAFPDESCYRIEKDPPLSSKSMQGVKLCECIVATRNIGSTLFIEAKSSAPRRPEAHAAIHAKFDTWKKSLEKEHHPDTIAKLSLMDGFRAYINDILQKFQDSYLVYHGWHHDWLKNLSIPETFKTLEPGHLRCPLFILILNIEDADKDELDNLQSALNGQIGHFCRSLGLKINPIIVMDRSTALSKKLIHQ